MPPFFEIGKVVLDRAEVGAIGRQEQDVVAMFESDGFEVFLFVERGVVVDDCGVRAQLFAQHVPCPIIDQIRIGCTFEQHGCQKVFASPCRDKAGSRTSMARVVAIDLFATQAPAVAATGCWLKAGFIDIHQIV